MQLESDDVVRSMPAGTDPSWWPRSSPSPRYPDREMQAKVAEFKDLSNDFFAESVSYPFFLYL